MVCNQNIIEKMESTFSVNKIDFDINAVKNIIIEDKLECGMFEFRGVSDDIHSIYDVLSKVSKYKICVPKEYSKGFYELYFNGNQSFELYKNIVNEYPSVKVIGYCFDQVKIYRLFSETGYNGFTKFEFCNYINKTEDMPWWLNERPSRRPADKIGGFSDSLWWSTVDFVIRNENGYYQLMKKDDDTSIRELKLVSYEEKKLKDYKLEWTIKKVGEHYVLKKYIGNNENVFIPGRINGCGVILGSNLFTTGNEYFSSLFNQDINENVKNILVGDGVVEIKSGAFAGCSYLENISFPEKIDKIGNDILFNCHFIDAEIIVGNNLVLASRKNKANEMIISGKVEIVKRGAFQNLKHIKKIIFDEGVREIETLPLGVERVEIPRTVKEIGAGLFSPLDNLKYVKLPNGIINIPEDCFSGCINLEQVEIPESVEEIHNKAFWYGEKLNKISDFFIPGAEGVIIPPYVKKMGICYFGPKVTVFDSLKSWEPLGDYVSLPSKNVLVTVCSELNNEIKYKVWMGYRDETDRTKEILMHCWDCNAEIRAEIYDELYSKYKSNVNKHLYVMYRLRYPYKIDEKHKKKLENYFDKNKSDIYKTLNELEDTTHLEVYNELLGKMYR